MTAYTVSTETSRNDEGSDFATVTVTWLDGEVEVHHFASYFDDPCESAVEQAASFICALDETVERHNEAERLGVHPLEIAFAPFGPEWQREQHDRDDIPF